MRILVVDRAWVEWIINLFLYKGQGPASAGPFFWQDPGSGAEENIAIKRRRIDDDQK